MSTLKEKLEQIRVLQEAEKARWSAEAQHENEQKYKKQLQERFTSLSNRILAEAPHSKTLFLKGAECPNVDLTDMLELNTVTVVHGYTLDLDDEGKHTIHVPTACLMWK